MSEIHGGHRNRLRQKIEKMGFESLYDHEMLEFILFASIPRRNTNDLAHKLIGVCGSYEEVFTADTETLKSVQGVGTSAVLQIKSYQHHIERVTGVSKPVYIKSYGDARDFFTDYFTKKKLEEFHMLLLDKKGEPIIHEIYSDRRNNGVVVPVNEIMQTISACDPDVILFAHNHPSGNANPSQKDIDFTNSVSSKIEGIFNISTCEHMIFGGEDCYSFRMNGFLERKL